MRKLITLLLLSLFLGCKDMKIFIPYAPVSFNSLHASDMNKMLVLKKNQIGFEITNFVSLKPASRSTVCIMDDIETFRCVGTTDEEFSHSMLGGGDFFTSLDENNILFFHECKLYVVGQDSEKYDFSNFYCTKPDEEYSRIKGIYSGRNDDVYVHYHVTLDEPRSYNAIRKININSKIEKTKKLEYSTSGNIYIDSEKISITTEKESPILDHDLKLLQSYSLTNGSQIGMSEELLAIDIYLEKELEIALLNPNNDDSNFENDIYKLKYGDTGDGVNLFKAEGLPGLIYLKDRDIKEDICYLRVANHKIHDICVPVSKYIKMIIDDKEKNHYIGISFRDGASQFEKIHFAIENDKPVLKSDWEKVDYKVISGRKKND